MRRLTDEQRERVAEFVPLALKLAAVWCRKRVTTPTSRSDVRSAFLFGLMGAVASYDAARGASLKTHIYLRLPGLAVDELRREWGRAGSGRAELRRRSMRIRAGTNPYARDPTGKAHPLPSGDRSPEDGARAADTIAGVRRNLPEEHARVLVETTAGGRLLGEVAREMGVNESRASQLRAEACELLRASGFMRRAFE